MSGSAAIAVSELTVARGGEQVLSGLTLAIRSGAVTGLLGPSGCGKSTLMRSIVGVQIVASGTVTVLGEPAGSAPLRRRVGYVTQAPSVYTDLSIQENLRFFAAVVGADATRIARSGRDGRSGRVRGPRRGCAVGRPAFAGVARHGVARPTGRARARRADGRPRSGAPGRAVGDVPPACERRAPRC